MRHLIFATWLVAFSLSAHAQVYKWVDENGKIQYSDQPPLEKTVQSEQQLKIQSAPVHVSDTEATSESKSLAEERLEYDKRRQDRKENEAKLRAEAEQNKKKCVDAQSRLSVFLETPRLRVPDGNGGIVWVDDDLRQQKINDAKAAIASHCE